MLGILMGFIYFQAQATSLSQGRTLHLNPRQSNQHHIIPTTKPRAKDSSGIPRIIVRGYSG